MLNFKMELTGAVVWNKWYDNLKSRIWSSAASYRSRRKLERLTTQKAYGVRADMAVKSVDVGEVVTAKAEMISLYNRKNHSLLVRARLKGFLPKQRK